MPLNPVKFTLSGKTVGDDSAAYLSLATGSFASPLVVEELAVAIDGGWVTWRT